MSSTDIAIRTSRLGKSYTIRQQAAGHITLAEQLLATMRSPRDRMRSMESSASSVATAPVSPHC
jgi:hypothetical protein